MNTRCLNSASKKGLLIKCLLISLGAHVCFLAYFYISPLVLHHARSPFALSSTAPTPLEIEDEAFEKNQIIDEVFQQIVLLSPHQQLPFDLRELPKGSALAPDPEQQELPFEKIVKIKQPIQRELCFSTPASDLILAHEIEVVPSLFASADVDTSVMPQLQIEAARAPLVLFKNPIAYASDIDPENIVSLSTNALVTAHPEEGRLSLEPLYGKEAEKLQIRTDKKMLSGTIAIKDLPLEEQTLTPLFLPPAPEQTLAKLDFGKFASESAYDFSEHELTSAWNDDFDVEVTYLPNPEGEGYIFSATITPNKEISAFSLKQNIYFVLDRSGSIAKHRFAVFKRAVLKGLASMQKDDTFNIVIVDKKIARFKTESVVATLKNIRAAETFLDKQESAGFFDSNDIYSSLEKLLPHIPDNDEMHTIVLLTDGKTKLNTERKHKALKHWLHENNTRVALYAAAVGSENDLVTLDLLSTVSGGRLLYSDTHASFPRKIAKLMIDLKNPLAKNIVINAIPHDSNTNITFQNARPHMPALFSHTPYVVYGTIDHPGNFDLIVHGRHRNQWVGISKEIAFTEDNRHDIEFASRWGEQLANLCYSKFLQEGKIAHLKEAKEILKKSRTQVAF